MPGSSLRPALSSSRCLAVFMQRRMRRRKFTRPKLELQLETHGAELKNAAVTTSQVTGALGYMDYGDVSRYASIYDLQAQFMRLQERQRQHFFVLAFVRHIGDV